MTVIATAGHVDHGKSSLIRALTGTDPDRLSEEKQRGMTIDLGFAHTTTPSGQILSFIDVPGHVDFIRNMIAGVSHVGVVLLVVDASEGWMPQTTEHCDVVSLLGSKQFVVALTKSDRVDTHRIVQVAGDVRSQLAQRDVEVLGIVPTSVTTNDGIRELREMLGQAVAAITDNQFEQRTRLFIDRVFTMTGAGTVVTGTLQGSISVDDHVVVVRHGTPLRVRGIQSHGQKVETAIGPVRVALNVTGADIDDLARGDVLVVAQEWNVTTQCDATLNVLSTLDHSISKRGQYILHVGTSDQAVQLRVLGNDVINPGEQGIVRLSFHTPLPLLPGDRFIIRETGRSETVGGGVALDAHPVVSVTKARPDGSASTYLKERGWVSVAQVWKDTDQYVEPVVGEWTATQELVAQTRTNLENMMNDGGRGVDVSVLQPWERLLLEQINGVVISHGVALRGSLLTADEERIAELIRDAGRTGLDTTNVARDVMRRLVQHGMVYEHDGIVFHTEALDGLRDVLAELWREHPQGFTMAALRDATGLTRKHAVPLGTVLDKHGLTKRVGDVRVPGPRY